MSIKLGSGGINKVYLGSSEMNKVYLGSTVIYEAIAAVLGTPTLSNFRVENANPDRVLFDSSDDITGLTVQGFAVSRNTISSISVNGTSTTGHYFVLDSAFTYWDKANTIRLESGNGVVYDFTMIDIDNQISEPDAATIRYAVAGGAGAQNGTSEADAWSYNQAFANATSGMTVHMKAGVETSGITVNNNGTPSAPIKFIGYKTTPGDITTNYYDYVSETAGANDIDTSEMPSLVGTDPNSGNGMVFNGKEYIIVKNFQTEDFYYHVRSTGDYSGSDSNNLVFERYNSHFAGDASGLNDASGFKFRSWDNAGDNCAKGSKNISIIDSVFIDHKQISVLIVGDGYSYLNNVKTYCTEGRFSTTAGDNLRNDYHIANGGWGNVYKNCYSENINNTTGWNSNLSTHGIGIRSAEQYRHSTQVGSQYNLIIGCEVVNIYDGIYFRNFRCDNNVAKDFVITNGGNTLDYRTGGLMIMSGCDDNVFEQGTVDGVSWGIYFTNNQEDGSTDTHSGDNNIFRNVIFSNCNRQIAVHSDGTGGTTSDGTKIEHCTFYNPSTFAADISDISHTMTNWTVKNCIIDDAASAGPKIGSISFDYNNIWNSWATSIGTNSSNVNPNYVNQGAGDYEPQATFTDIDAPKLTGADYDFEGAERASTTTMGAIKHADEEGAAQPPAPSGELYPTGDAASIDANESNSVSLWTNEGNGTISVNSSDSFNGSYSVEVRAGDDRYERHRIEVTGITSGQAYDFTWYEKLLQGSNCRVYIVDPDGSTVHLNQSVVSGTWTARSTSFTAVSSGTLILKLYAIVNDQGAINDGFLFDNASITQQ